MVLSKAVRTLESPRRDSAGVIRANCVTGPYRSWHLFESYQFEVGPLTVAVTRGVLAVMDSEQPVREARSERLRGHRGTITVLYAVRRRPVADPEPGAVAQAVRVDPVRGEGRVSLTRREQSPYAVPVGDREPPRRPR